MQTIEEKFGERVRQLRVERDWSQEELAYRSGLHRTYISSMERGKRNVSLQCIERIAKAFGIPIYTLMELSCEGDA